MSTSSSLHGQLLEQARHLANRERKRPQQASLGRAVSAAYYALFHFLIGEACRSFLGAAAAGKSLRLVMARAFNHRQLLEASRAFKAPVLSDAVLKGAVKGTAIPPDLVQVARAFEDLQEKRHEADYDLSVLLKRKDVINLIDRVEVSIAGWEVVRDEPSARLYLLSLLFWDRMTKSTR